MSGKISKTARASAGMQATKKIVIPDDELIKNLRNEVASGLYPTSQGSHALLRAYDAALAQMDGMRSAYDGMLADRDLAKEEVEQLKRQLVLADSVIESKTKALNDIAAVASIDPATLDLTSLTQPKNGG